MKPQEKLDAIIAERDANEKRLSVLRKQKAFKGIHTEPYIEIDITQTQETIEYLREHERFYRGEVSFLKMLLKTSSHILLIRRSKEIIDTIIPRIEGLSEDNSYNTLINEMYQTSIDHLENSLKTVLHPDACYLLARIFDKNESHSGVLHYCCLCINLNPTYIEVRKLRLSTSQFLLKKGDPDAQELKKYIVEDKAKLIEVGQFSEEMIWIDLD